MTLADVTLLIGKIIALTKLVLMALVLVAGIGLLTTRLGLPWPLRPLSGDLTGIAAILAACGYIAK